MKSSSALAAAPGSVSSTAPHCNLHPCSPVARRPLWQRYFVSLVCIGIAFAIRYLLRPVLGDELPFMLFIAASLVATWYGGADAGVLAFLLGLVLGDYFFISRGRFGIAHSVEGLSFLRYLFTTSLGITLIELLHRGSRRLHREMERRKESEQALLQAQMSLQKHAEILDRRIEERTVSLVENVKFLEGLLYHIAHNLRAPARAIDGFMSVLLQEYGPKLNKQSTYYCHAAKGAAARMDRMIQDLLQYGRLGHLEVHLANVSLAQVVRKAMSQLSFDIQDRHAGVEIQSPLPSVWADPAILEEALVHLLENAIRFVPPERVPHIRVFTETINDAFRLSIQDNGPGIDPRYHEAIFRPFESLSPAHTQSGTGMGLAVVREALQRMNGKVGVESQLGRGSRFWLELPVAEKQSP